MEKFCEVTPPNPKVISEHTLNFMPIFKCSLLKIVGGLPSPMGSVLASLGHFLMRVQISRASPPTAEIWSSEKVYFGGSKLTSPTLLSVGQSSPDFCAERGGGGVAVDTLIFRFWINPSVSEIFAIEV